MLRESGGSRATRLMLLAMVLYRSTAAEKTTVIQIARDDNVLTRTGATSTRLLTAERQGYSSTCATKERKFFYLRATANLSTAELPDCTDDIHGKLLAGATVAKIIGLTLLELILLHQILAVPAGSGWGDCS